MCCLQECVFPCLTLSLVLAPHASHALTQPAVYGWMAHGALSSSWMLTLCPSQALWRLPLLPLLLLPLLPLLLSPLLFLLLPLLLPLLPPLPPLVLLPLLLPVQVPTRRSPV